MGSPFSCFCHLLEMYTYTYMKHLYEKHSIPECKLIHIAHISYFKTFHNSKSLIVYHTHPISILVAPSSQEKEKGNVQLSVKYQALILAS